MAWNNTGYWMREPPILGRVKILFSDQLLVIIYYAEFMLDTEFIFVIFK